MDPSDPQTPDPADANGRDGARGNLTFRPLADSDLTLLYRWLNDPAVVRWWEGEDVSGPAVQRDYGTAREDPAEQWIALLDGEPVGWIQCYPADAEADDEAYYWANHLALESTGGIDYLIGEARLRGRGMGSAMIRAFVRDVVFPRHPEWTHAAAGPFEENVASWKALEHAGFVRVARLDDEAGPCILMAIHRDDLQV
jgi:RimJ/RimL family protein N-acetyltransferase